MEDQESNSSTLSGSGGESDGWSEQEPETSYCDTSSHVNILLYSNEPTDSRFTSKESGRKGELSKIKSLVANIRIENSDVCAGIADRWARHRRGYLSGNS